MASRIVELAWDCHSHPSLYPLSPKEEMMRVAGLFKLFEDADIPLYNTLNALVFKLEDWQESIASKRTQWKRLAEERRARRNVEY